MPKNPENNDSPVDVKGSFGNFLGKGAVNYLDRRTASFIAFGLLALLAAIIGAQYYALWGFATNNDGDIKVLQDLFGQVFPAITGLVGAATAYYFSSKGKQSD